MVEREPGLESVASRHVAGDLIVIAAVERVMSHRRRPRRELYADAAQDDQRQQRQPHGVSRTSWSLRDALVDVLLHLTEASARWGRFWSASAGKRPGGLMQIYLFVIIYLIGHYAR